jgi:two-component system cell cycle response regulator
MRKAYILVVDDNKITTKLMRKYLESHGFEATEAYDGVDALEKIAQRIPDAIVLDVMMPRMDGYETVRQLRDKAETKNIPVVIVTALNDVLTQIKAIETGADDFLSKPVEEKLLIAKAKLLSNLSIKQEQINFLFKVCENIKSSALPVSEIDNTITSSELF